MGTLKRIAIALESIANDLHILVANTNKEASSQQMGTNDVKEKSKEDFSKICSQNAKQPRWSIKEVNTLMKMLNNKAGYEEIAATLNRSCGAVRAKISDMGLGKRSRRNSNGH